MYSPKQADVMLNADARWNLLTGATRSGKTHVTYDLLLKRMRTQPPGNCLLIGKTERTLKRNVLNPLRERFGEKYVSRVFGDGEVYLFGRHCYITGANDERAVTKIQGMSAVYAYGDEVTTWPESVFQMLKSRLDKPGAKFDGTCNPEGPYHWLKKDVIDKKDELNVKHWHFTLDDNPFLDPEFVESLKKEYSGVWYQRYILGLWVMAEGIIYDMFDQSKHVVPTVDRPYTQYYVSCDYGTQNPMAFGLWGFYDGVWYKVKEYHYDGRARGRQKTDEDYYQDLLDFVGNLPIRSIIIDPSAASFIATIRKRGRFHVRQAKNDVKEGIRNMATALTTRKILYNDCCKETFREFASYVWDEKAAERGEEKPVKQNDHQMDADRYFVNTVVMRGPAISFD